ncbi:MAG: type II toxin-antitoxin system RelE/ParE family toxin [bacterium]
MFEIKITVRAEEDLRYFRKHEQKTILDTIENQLIWEPTTETKNRKALVPNDLSRWELRIGEYRVFYDVDEDTFTVKIKAVGYKVHNQLFFRGKEFHL